MIVESHNVIWHLLVCQQAWGPPGKARGPGGPGAAKTNTAAKKNDIAGQKTILQVKKTMTAAILKQIEWY